MGLSRNEATSQTTWGGWTTQGIARGNDWPAHSDRFASAGISELPVDDRKDGELVLGLDDVDQPDLDSIEILGVVHECQHDPAEVLGDVDPAPLESLAGALGAVEKTGLEAHEPAFRQIDRSRLPAQKRTLPAVS